MESNKLSHLKMMILVALVEVEKLESDALSKQKKKKPRKCRAHLKLIRGGG